jgi:predicted RNA-binding protein with RPS1 domain
MFDFFIKKINCDFNSKNKIQSKVLTNNKKNKISMTLSQFCDFIANFIPIFNNHNNVL